MRIESSGEALFSCYAVDKGAFRREILREWASVVSLPLRGVTGRFSRFPPALLFR